MELKSGIKENECYNKVALIFLTYLTIFLTHTFFLISTIPTIQLKIKLSCTLINSIGTERSVNLLNMKAIGTGQSHINSESVNIVINIFPPERSVKYEAFLSAKRGKKQPCTMISLVAISLA